MPNEALAELSPSVKAAYLEVRIQVLGEVSKRLRAGYKAMSPHDGAKYSQPLRAIMPHEAANEIGAVMAKLLNEEAAGMVDGCVDAVEELAVHARTELAFLTGESAVPR